MFRVPHDPGRESEPHAEREARPVLPPCRRCFHSTLLGCGASRALQTQYSALDSGAAAGVRRGESRRPDPGVAMQRQIELIGAAWGLGGADPGCAAAPALLVPL